MSALTAEQIAVLEREALPGVLVGKTWRSELATVQFTDEQTSAVYEIYTALANYSAPRGTPTTTVWNARPEIFESLLRISATRDLITRSLQTTLKSDTAVDALLDLQRVAALVTLDVRAQRFADAYFTARDAQSALKAVHRYEQATHELAVAVAAVYSPAKEELHYELGSSTQVLSTARLRVLPSSDDEGVPPELPPPQVGGTGLARRSLVALLRVQLYSLYSLSIVIVAMLSEVIQAWLTDGGKVNLPFGMGAMTAKEWYQQRYTLQRAQQAQASEPVTYGYVNISRLPWWIQTFGDFGLGYYGVLQTCATSTTECLPRIEPAAVTKLYQEMGANVQEYIAKQMYGQVDLTTMNMVETSITFGIVALISKALSVLLLSLLLDLTIRIAFAGVSGVARGVGGVFRAVGATDRDL